MQFRTQAHLAAGYDLPHPLPHGFHAAAGKAANAGGVATSALEMSQNSMRFYYTFEEVEAKLDYHQYYLYIQHKIRLYKSKIHLELFLQIEFLLWTKGF